MTLTLSVVENVKHGKKSTKKTVVIGHETVTVNGGSTISAKVTLNGAGKKLAKRAPIHAKLTATSSGKTIAAKAVVFKKAKKNG